MSRLLYGPALTDTSAPRLPVFDLGAPGFTHAWMATTLRAGDTQWMDQIGSLDLSITQGATLADVGDAAALELPQGAQAIASGVSGSPQGLSPWLW